MLTVSEDDEDLFAAVRAGATGYLLKEVSIDEVAGRGARRRTRAQPRSRRR